MTSLIYSTGAVSVSNGSAVVTGSLTGWAVALVKGGGFSCAGFSIPIVSVEDDTHLTLAYPWPGLTSAAAAYAISRDTSEAVQAAWTNDRLATIIQRLSLVGVHPDGSGTLAERNALSPVPDKGYLWLHAQAGVPLAFYRKVASGWEGPYAVEGATGAPGIPGPALNPAGAWVIGSTYGYGSYVSYGGRTFVSKGDGNVGNEPPSADVDDAFWMFVPTVVGPQGPASTVPGPSSTIAVGTVTSVNYGQPATVVDVGAPGAAVFDFGIPKGADGTGTGDMVGPAGAVDGHIVLFDGTTGKFGKDGGKGIGDLATATQGGKADTALQSIVPGDNITVDNTDPMNPIVASSGGGGAIPGHIFGLTLSNNAVDANNDIDIAPGQASSTDLTMVLKLTSTMTKRLDAAWAVGSGNGGLDTGTVAGDAWYHVHAIGNPATGATDALFSLSPTAPTMPSGWTAFRRLGAIFPNGAKVIQPFFQSGNEFLLPKMALNVNVTNPGTSGVLSGILSVPSGVQVWAKLSVMISNSALVRVAVLITSPDQPDTVPATASNSTLVTGLLSAAGASQGQVAVRTNTSRQVRYRVDQTSATVQLFIATLGWIDPL